MEETRFLGYCYGSITLLNRHVFFWNEIQEGLEIVSLHTTNIKYKVINSVSVSIAPSDNNNEQKYPLEI